MWKVMAMRSFFSQFSSHASRALYAQTLALARLRERKEEWEAFTGIFIIRTRMRKKGKQFPFLPWPPVL